MHFSCYPHQRGQRLQKLLFYWKSKNCSWYSLLIYVVLVTNGFYNVGISWSKLLLSLYYSGHGLDTYLMYSALKKKVEPQIKANSLHQSKYSTFQHSKEIKNLASKVKILGMESWLCLLLGWVSLDKLLHLISVFFTCKMKIMSLIHRVVVMIKFDSVFM